MTETLANNAWVESYLDALLSKGGLSNEHVAAAGNSPGARGVGGARGGEGGGMFDALMDDEERSITARYYVHQILSLDEERIRDAWSKASRPAKSGGLTAERDARMEHLSWRVWAMKRRRAQVDATLQDAARQAASDAMMAEADEDEADATTLQTIDDLNFATAGDSEDVEDEEVEGESELMGDEEEEGEEGEELSTGNGSGAQAPGQHLLSTAVRRVIASSRRQRPPSGAPSQTPPLSEADSGRASASTRGASSSTPTASAPAATTPPGGRLPSGSDGGAAAPGFPGLSPFASTPQSPFSTTPRAGARPAGGAALGVGGGAGNGPGGREGAAGPRMVSPPPTPPPTANASGQLSGAPSLRQAPSAAGSGTQSMAPPTPPLTALQPPATPPATPPGARTPLQPAGGSGTVGTLSAAAAAGPPAPLGASTPPPDPLLVSRFPRLYILLISMHGLVRGEKMELGKDPDTGGQVKYVVELAKALARFPSVARVDLLTRLIKDPKVDPSYGVEQEPLTISGLPPPPPASADPSSSPAAPLAPAGQSGELGGQSGSAATASGSSPRGAYIVRLAAGDPALYLRKEELWPHLREFADRAIAHASATLAKLQEGGEGPCELYMVHGHYADAGEVAALVAHTLGVDCMLTGHSLGRNKREHLLKSGTVSFAEVEATYAMSRRIEAEERALDAASVVFTSTQQEVAEQWGAYDGYSDELSAALQLRPCKGYHVPRMAVIPPGLDFSNLKVSLSQDPWEAVLGPLAAAPPPALPPANSSRSNSRGGAPPTLQDSALANPPPSAAAGPGQGPGGVAPDAASTASGVSSSHSEGGAGPLAPAPHASPSGKTPSSLLAAGPEPPLWREVARFLRHPGKPVILAMCRPDPKKNILGLLHAYGRSRLLRELANLVLVLGNRDIIDSMAPGSARVMADVLKLIDAYDLYGCVAYPKKHSQADISDIYLLAAATRGVFVNAALQEPFGLTLIEAAAHGVPIVATTHGGPVDIVATLRNGVLVDPNNIRSITEACTSLITSPRTWDELSESGRRNITAYSWPSHCARALRTVEDQKATQLAASRSRLGGFMGAAGFGGPTSGTTHGPNSFTSNNKNVGVHATGHTVTTMRHTLSLSFDDLASLARAIASNPNISSAAVITEAVTSAAAAAAPTTATGAAAAAAAGGGGGVGGGLTGKGAKHPSFTASDRAGGFAAEGGGGESVEAEQASGLARRSIELARANRAGSLPAAALHKLFGSSRRLLGGVGAPAGTRAGQGGRGGLGGAGEGLLSPSSGNGGKTSKVGLQVSVRGPSLLSGGAGVPGAKEGVTEAGGGVTEGGSGASGLTRAGSGAGSASGLRRAGSGSRGSGKPGGVGGATAAAAKATLGAAGGTLPGGLISSLRGLGGALLGGGSAGKLAMSTVAEASDAEEAAAGGGAAGGGAAAGGAAAGKGEVGLGRALESGTYSGSLHNHTPRMCHHERFVVVTIDSLADVPQAAALIRALLEAGSDATSQDAAGGSFPAAARDAVLKGWATGAAGELGVGVACTWSAQEMRALLEEQGVDPRELDFMVCNAGSLIWHTTADPTHSASSPNLAALAASPPRPPPGSERTDCGGSGHMAVAGALFACDDEWERHLDMRWDERVVGQVLRRIIATKVGWGKLAISRGPAGAAGPAPVPVKGTGIAAAAAAAAASQQAGRAGSTVEGAEKVVGKVEGGMGQDLTDKYRALAPASATEAQGEAAAAAAAAAAVEPPTPAAAVAAPGPGLGPQAGVTSPQLASPSSDPAAVAGKAGGQGAAASPAAAAAGAVSTPVSLQLSPCSTPLHFMMHADILPQPTVAAGGKAARGTMGTGDVALNLLGTVRRKLRMSGLRTQLVAAAHDSLSGTSPEGGVTLHITPLRCSRALAIRHLAHRFKKPLDRSWTVVAFAANHSPATDKSFAPDASLAHGTASGWVVTPSSGAVSEAGSMGRRASASVSAVARPPAVEVVGLRASDGEDLVSGVQRVVLVPSFAPPGAQRQKGAASARCTFPVDIVVHGSQVRVQQVNASGESAAEGANSSSRVTVLVPS